MCFDNITGVVKRYRGWSCDSECFAAIRSRRRFIVGAKALEKDNVKQQDSPDEWRREVWPFVKRPRVGFNQRHSARMHAKTTIEDLL